jgi:hypothetical protein
MYTQYKIFFVFVVAIAYLLYRDLCILAVLCVYALLLGFLKGLVACCHSF